MLVDELFHEGKGKREREGDRVGGDGDVGVGDQLFYSMAIFVEQVQSKTKDCKCPKHRAILCRV